VAAASKGGDHHIDRWSASAEYVCENDVH